MEGWTAVEITLPAGAGELVLDLLSGALFEMGAAGLEVRDQAEPTVVVASFAPDRGPQDLAQEIEASLASANISAERVHLRGEVAVDWATHWRANFQPERFGSLWVVPTWLEPPGDAMHVLRIDPGMAFGTGHHETTALCLDRIVAAPKLDSVLDVGTGTGILAMAALLLGAHRAVGIDSDPDALTVARENAAANGLADRLVLSDLAPDALDERFDLIVANIVRDPLIMLLPAIARALAPAGRVALAGILVEQVETVTTAAAAAGLVQRAVRTRGEWALIELSAREDGS